MSRLRGLRDRLGLRLSLTRDNRAPSTAPVVPPQPGQRNITRTLGPGNDGAGLSPGTSAETRSTTLQYVNESGQPLTTLALVVSGWAAINNAAEQDIPSPVTVTGTVAYPVGSGAQAVPFAGQLQPGTDLVSTEIALATPIPPGATFEATVSATLAVGQKVPLARDSVNAYFRPSGIVSTLPAIANRLVLWAAGDSIITNNGMPTTLAAAGICPIVQMSIVGATLFQNVGNYAKRFALAKLLGCTHAVVNYRMNDHTAGRTLAQMQADATALADGFQAQGIRTVWATGSPRANVTPSVSVSALSAAGGVISATVADASPFAVGQLVPIVGATPATFNGTKIVTAINGNVVSLAGPNVADGAATGTITIARQFNYVGQQLVPAGNFSGGEASVWSQFSAWLRTHPGNIVDHVEITDGMAISRTDPRFRAARADTAGFTRDNKTNLTISGLTNASRFDFADDGDSYANNWCTMGTVLWLTGPNAGTTSTISASNTPRNVSLSAAPANPIAAGHTFAVRLAETGRLVTDGTHPNSAYGFGGVPLMTSLYRAKLTALKAAA